MPEVDALQATRFIRACLGPQPYLVTLTANAMEVERGHAAGADLTKPVALAGRPRRGARSPATGGTLNRRGFALEAASAGDTELPCGSTMTDPQRFRSRLTVRYLSALALIALVAISGQIVVQSTLSAQTGDAREINLAGRQRMLSQRIAKHALEARHQADPAPSLSALRADVNTWAQVHRALLDGDPDRGLHGITDPGTRAMMDSLTASVETVVRASGQSPVQVEAILAAERRFLPTMDRVVFALDAESSQNVQSLRHQGAWVVLLILIVLVALGYYVFRPAVEWGADALATSRRRPDGLDVPEPSGGTSHALIAFRWVLVAAAVAVPAFWFVYRVIDPGSYDPLVLRLAYSAFVFAVLAATFASKTARRLVWHLSLGASVVMVAYFTWLCVHNGLSSVWTLGVLTAGSASVLSLSPYARSLVGVWAAVGVTIAAIVVTLWLSQAPFDASLLLSGYSAVLALLVGIGSTLQVRTRQELQANRDELVVRERLLRTVIDTIPDHIYVKDTEARATLRNQASARAMGYTDPAQSVGQSDLDAAPEQGRIAFTDDLQVLETGEAIVDKVERDTDGGWLLTTKVPLRGARGEVVGLVGVSRDVTAQKTAEQALRTAKETAEAQKHEAERSRHMLRTVIDAVPDVIVVLRAGGEVAMLNAAATKDFGGREVSDIENTRLADLLPPEEAKLLSDGYATIADRNEPVLDMPHTRTVDGEERSFVTSRIPISGPSGTVVVGVSRDVTEQEHARRALVESKEMAETAREAAEAATRAKSEFLANMSHEIRTPMNGVIGMTSLLMDTPLDREQRDFVETIRTSGDALLTIINDILDFSKIEAGMLSLEVHPFEVRKAVEEALDLVAQPAAEKGVELAYLIEDGVPRTIKGDVTRVRQVLVNLLSNAVKFTPSGSVCVRVTATPTDAAAGALAQVLFAVEDTGIGIAPDKLDLVFESFSQADASTTRKFGGTGLGLTICRHLTEMMGGEMGVESELGAGSTFRFSIEAEVAASERRVFLHSEQPALEGRRVLIVDDNDVNREILTKLSSRWRMTSDEARSGAEGIEAAQRARAEGRPYDLVLLDMQMPEMDGLEVARALTGPDGPVIVMLTSISREGGMRQVAREAGVHRLLYKPTKPSQLYDALIEAFDGRPSTQPAATPDGAVATAWISRPDPTLDPASIRILLAEDNVVNQKVALRLLARLGHDADVVANGAEALASVEARAQAGGVYDVVFMDVQMPEMDGLEANRRIRASAAVVDQPWIVSLTANAMEGDREDCLASGADDYLPKPVQLSSMREALERAVQSRLARRHRSPQTERP